MTASPLDNGDSLRRECIVRRSTEEQTHETTISSVGRQALCRAAARGDQIAIIQIDKLPPELLFHLSRFLDLASLIVLSRATSRSLRVVFDQFDRELMFLEPSHRLNLGEWREAARRIDRLILARLPGQFRHTKGLDLTRDESLVDLDFFQAILGFLDKTSASRHSSNALDPGGRQTTPHPPATAGCQAKNQLRCLYLPGWHGVAGAFLIQQLRWQPSLRDVTTIVKTERADSRIWLQAALDDQKAFSIEQTPMVAGSSRVEAPQPSRLRTSAPDSPSAPSTERSTMSFNKCTSTQFIVQVGKRRPRRPGQGYLRGEGIQMGYQGYCIDIMTPHHNIRSGDAEVAAERLSEDGTYVRACSGSLEEAEAELAAENAGVFKGNSLGTDSSQENAQKRKKLHVVLLGREELSAEEEDRKQIEEMFERSVVTCNHCKEGITF